MVSRSLRQRPGAGVGVRRETAWAATLLALVAIAWTLIELGPFAVVAVLGAAGVLLAILRYPWIGVALLVASVPAQEFGAIQAGGQTLTVTRAVFPLALAGYVISLLARKDRVAGSLILVPYALFVWAVVASMTWASSIGAAAADSGRWLIALVSFVVLVHFTLNASSRRLIALVAVMAVAGVFQATYGVTQSILALGPESFRVGAAGSRAFGTFGQPNSYAGYMEMVFFPVFWMAVYLALRLPARLRAVQRSRRSGFHASRQERMKLLALFAVTAGFAGSSALILSGIVASYSRGAWLGVAAGGLATAIFFHRRVRIAIFLALPLAALVALGGGGDFVPGAINERVTSGFDDLRLFDASRITVTEENFAAVERMAHWQAGWRMFDDNLAVGVGAGNFNELYSEYYVREQFRFTRGHAHNYYVHVLAELGIVGLALYVWLMGSLASIALFVLIQAPQGFNRMLALGAFGTIVSVGVHNVFENLHVLNLSIQLSAVWALAIAAHRRWRSGADAALE